ncbi:MAG TPA: CotH kinase family protein [Verrucomicrobiae bacterium]|nr:CotH kinase family protein [Verrucomicrobiae bacterium]
MKKGQRAASMIILLVASAAIISASVLHAFSFAPKPASRCHDIFDGRTILVLELRISPASSDSLRLKSRKYVSAQLFVGGELFQNIGLHLKGRGTFQPLEAKPSFTLNLLKFGETKKLGGQSKIHLNNSAEDSTFLQEQIGARLFQAAGVPAPKVVHALVTLNGRELGLYILKEGFSEEFLARSFGNADGALYDNEGGHDVDQAMKRHGGNCREAGLERLASAALEPDLDLRWRRLSQLLDSEQFVSFAAMEIILCHWDGYALAQNNFRVYHDPGRDKYIFLPSGMDQLFGNARLPWRPQMSGLVCRAFLEVPEGRRLFERRFRVLVDEVLNPARIVREAASSLATLHDAVSSHFLARATEDADELYTQIFQRRLELDAQLLHSSANVMKGSFLSQEQMNRYAQTETGFYAH